MMLNSTPRRTEHKSSFSQTCRVELYQSKRFDSVTLMRKSINLQIAWDVWFHLMHCAMQDKPSPRPSAEAGELNAQSRCLRLAQADNRRKKRQKEQNVHGSGVVISQDLSLPDR